MDGSRQMNLGNRHHQPRHEKTFVIRFMVLAKPGVGFRLTGYISKSPGLCFARDPASLISIILLAPYRRRRGCFMHQQAQALNHQVENRHSKSARTFQGPQKPATSAVRSTVSKKYKYFQIDKKHQHVVRLPLFRSKWCVGTFEIEFFQIGFLWRVAFT